MRNPLRVVEPLDSEDEPAALVLALQLREQPGCLGLLQRRSKAFNVDPDRVHADPDAPTVQLERVGLRVDAEDPQARRAEVPRIVADLEAHVIGAEHAAQELLPLGQKAIHLGGREGRMQEEADREPRLAHAQHRRNEHQVEVVDPDPTLRLAVGEDRVREALVHLDVALPGLGRDAQSVGEVVEERPERVVADLVVEVLFVGRAEKNGVEVGPRKPLRHTLLEGGRNDRPRPAHPRRVTTNGLESRGEPARAARDLDLVAGDRQPNGKAVARDHERVLSAVACQTFSFVPIRGRYNLCARE